MASSDYFQQIFFGSICIYLKPNLAAFGKMDGKRIGGIFMVLQLLNDFTLCRLYKCSLTLSLICCKTKLFYTAIVTIKAVNNVSVWVGCIQCAPVMYLCTSEKGRKRRATQHHSLTHVGTLNRSVDLSD